MVTAMFEPLECRQLFDAGELDPTFATDASPTLAVVQVPGQDAVEFDAVAVYPDGRVLAGGHGFVETPAGATNNRLLLARFNPDGTLDASFGKGGFVSNTPRGQDQVRNVALLSDGSIIALTSGRDRNLLHFSATGRLDPSF